MLFSLLLFGITAGAATPATWHPLGEQIGAKPGESFIGEERFGVAINDRGSRIAFGGNANFGVVGEWPALVRVYDYFMGKWHQVGGDLLAPSPSNGGAASLALDGAGTKMAVGFRRHSSGGASQNGIVRVYEFDGEYQEGAWNQLGTDLTGENSSDMFGEQVVLSGDGMTLAASSTRYDNMRGQVKVYRYGSGTWSQLGDDVIGEAEGHESGYALAISEDGNRIAIGAHKHHGNGVASGHVRIYDWLNGAWERVEELSGGNAGDEFGSSVALSADGKTCAIGAPLRDGMGDNSGSVRVYREVNDDWQLVGAEVMGEAAGDMSGSSLSMNANGTRIAIAARFNDAGGLEDAGHARVFDLVDETWVKYGSDLDGAGALHEFGQTVVLSADGTSLGVTSAPYSGGSAGGLFTFTEQMMPAEAATAPAATTTVADYGDCTDFVPEGADKWYDVDEYDCASYARFGACASDGADERYKNFDRLASEACCACGGGANEEEDDNANGAWRVANQPSGLVLTAAAIGMASLPGALAG